MSPCLLVENLRKTYRGNWLFDSTEAVRGVSFSIEPGERVGILGPNGAGKSTTFRAACALLRPTSGRIELFGLPPSRVEARARLGYLPENAQFHEFLTGEEYVDLAARLSGVPGGERAARVAATLDRVGLGAARKRRIRTYSKGMTQRIGVAQAIIGKPALVVLDEPMTGLDPVGRREVREILASLAEDGTAVVFSTHVLQDVELVCDRVVMLAGGRVLRAGTLVDLLAGREGPVEITVRGISAADADRVSAGVQSVRVATAAQGLVYRAPNPDAGEGLRAALAAAGGRVVAMVPLAATLEEAFLDELARAKGEPQ